MRVKSLRSQFLVLRNVGNLSSSYGQNEDLFLLDADKKINRVPRIRTVPSGVLSRFYSFSSPSDTPNDGDFPFRQGIKI